MKFFVKFSVLVLCVMLLASCGSKTLTGGVWENEKTSIQFGTDNTMTVQEDKSEKTYFYEDCTGEKNNKYIKIYDSSDKVKTGEFLRFIPYYIEDDVLRIDGAEYEFNKK